MSAAVQQSGTTRIFFATQDAFRVARETASMVAESLATASSRQLEQIREGERTLDTLDREIDQLVTSTISGATDHVARELLACMKLTISLERIGDLLLSVANRAQTIAAKLEGDDLRELTIMATRVEKMILDADKAFRERDLDAAVAVLRADSEVDRLRNLVVLRHLEPGSERNPHAFHTVFMAQELERAGDHAKNMAEEVCHLVSGKTVRHVLRSYDRPVEQMYLDHLRKSM